MAIKLFFPIQPKVLVSALFVATLSGCATPPPANPENVCHIFEEHRDWYHAAADVRERWGVPIGLRLLAGENYDLGRLPA